MTAKEKQIELARYRLRQAEESIEEAVCLLSGKNSPRSIINRVYYAMFYAVLSLLIFESFSSSKHSGVLSYFNKRFIKEGVFSQEIADSINDAFDLRQKGDYREYADLTYEQVEPFIEKAKGFVNAIRSYLEKNVFSK